MTAPKRNKLLEKVSSLFQDNVPKKAIARRLGINVRRVRRLLKKAGLSEPPTTAKQSKLDPYREEIKKRVDEGLSNERILREIRDEGYQGGKTILGDYIRTIRPAVKSERKAFRRFETSPAQEAQVDWSPFRVVIAGTERIIHCFAMVLGFSRMLFIQMHRDERLPTLLQAHVDAFHFFGGVCARIVYDNMATITLGRRRKKVIWNSRFLEFARHWMFEPVLCRPRDPNRKGKIESVFSYLLSSFLKGRSFSSWEELDRESMRWLREVANPRLHGTTHRVPQEMWLEERSLLTAPPEIPFPTYRQEIRSVYHDCTISVAGVRYSVPSDLARHTVCVRVYPRHIEILDAKGVPRAKHAIADHPSGIVIDPSHYQEIRRRDATKAGDVECRFLTLFPEAERFLDGLKSRMKSLYLIHLQKIDRLVTIYTLENTCLAIEEATRFRNFNANAIERILEHRHPLAAVEPPDQCLFLSGPVQDIDDVESGSLEEYQSYTCGESTQRPTCPDDSPQPEDDDHDENQENVSKTNR